MTDAIDPSGKRKRSRLGLISLASAFERVALAGSSPLLRQVYANAIGHCNFTTDHPRPLIVQNGLDR
jgi:hypothetical protein